MSSMALDCGEDACYGSTVLGGGELPLEVMALEVMTLEVKALRDDETYMMT